MQLKLQLLTFFDFRVLWLCRDCAIPALQCGRRDVGGLGRAAGLEYLDGVRDGPRLPRGHQPEAGCGHAQSGRRMLRAARPQVLSDADCCPIPCARLFHRLIILLSS